MNGTPQHELKTGDVCCLCNRPLKVGDLLRVTDDLDVNGFGVRWWAHDSCGTPLSEKEWPE